MAFDSSDDLIRLATRNPQIIVVGASRALPSEVTDATSDCVARLRAPRGHPADWNEDQVNFVHTAGWRTAVDADGVVLDATKYDRCGFR